MFFSLIPLEDKEDVSNKVSNVSGRLKNYLTAKKPDFINN